MGKRHIMSKRFIAIALIASACFSYSSASLSQTGAFIDQRDIFIGGLDGYHTFRIPSAVVSSSGTVLAFCEGRKEGASDAGNIDLLLKRSFDGGDLWQPMQTVWDDGPNTCGNPCPVVDRDTGVIWLLVTHNLGEDRESSIWDGTSKGTRTVWVMSSADDGATWSEPAEITSTTKLSDWTWYATGPGVGIQLRDGRLVIPCDHGVAGSRYYHSHVIFSDDHGRTWKPGGSAPDNTTSECQVVERADGSLLMNIRNYPAKNGMRSVSVSHDRGMTWSKASFDSELVCPGCQAGFIGLPGEKSRLLFTNPADPKDRVRMTVRLSYDDGETWPVNQVLHEGPAAYSCPVVLTGRMMACFYERGDDWRYEKLTFVRFNEEWLTGGKRER